MSLRIAAIADLHYAGGPLSACGARRTAIADVLLTRVVRRLNRFIKPDLTVFLGDMLDNGDSEYAQQEHEKLLAILAKLESPYIVLPGNHDGDIDRFYSHHQRPPEIMDVSGVRLLTFLDSQEPGYHAHRSSTDIARMDAARAGFEGPIVSLQHVPLFPPGASACPYSYTNAGEVWEAFERNRFALALSGHWHKGDDLVARGDGRAVIVPGLCESPFAFAEITVDGDKVETRRHELRLPEGPALMDYHIHTPFAYCSENMDNALTLELAKEFGLAGLAFTEHTGQLYFDRDTFWSASFLKDGIDTREGVQDRMGDYMALVRESCPPALLGLEIDCDYSGRPVARPEDWDAAQVRLGSIHWLDALRKPEPEIDLNAAAEEMLGRMSQFLGCGIGIFAHPLRLFRRWRDEDLPSCLIPGMMKLLREHGVAAEINFHGQFTSPQFLAACLDNGVKVVFGSDSHNLCEVGELQPHLDLMRACGVRESDFAEVMADIAGACLTVAKSG